MGASTGDDARLWAAACHLAALAGLVVPLGHLLGPLMVWLLKRGDDPFVDRQGKEALNFQISATLYVFLLILLGRRPSLASGSPPSRCRVWSRTAHPACCSCSSPPFYSGQW